ncbi:hypothetical protein CANCADRAFT_18749, partial [Tortispora caseinolytica NRRL Y-17796]
KEAFPVYPYPSQHCKRAQRGLFGGAKTIFGYTRTKFLNKSPRTWKPNIQTKKIWSESLQKLIRLKVATRVLKTIDKEHGLDNYLLKDSPRRVKELGEMGWRLRYLVLCAKNNI